MPDQPLNPFQPPAILSHLPAGSLTGGVAVEWLLFAVFAFWLSYTLVVIYHWLKYSHGSAWAYPAIGFHLFLSIALMAYALSGTILW